MVRDSLYLFQNQQFTFHRIKCIYSLTPFIWKDNHYYEFMKS